MFILGTLVNAIAIIVGALIGSFFTKIEESLKNTVMQGLAISVLILGVMMGLKADNFLIVIFAIVSGGIIGEKLKIEKRLNQLGDWLEQKVAKNGKGNISLGFVTASLVYTVGAMAILGSLDSGIRNDHTLLYTKAMLDGFSAIIFTSTLGIGVIFSAIPVFLYQGLIAFFATYIDLFLSDNLLNQVINNLTAAGGIMIIGISLNMLEIKKINVANLLPAIFMVVLIVIVLPIFQ